MRRPSLCGSAGYTCYLATALLGAHFAKNIQDDKSTARAQPAPGAPALYPCSPVLHFTKQIWGIQLQSAGQWPQGASEAQGGWGKQKLGRGSWSFLKSTQFTQVIWDISDKVRPGVKNVVDDIRDQVGVYKSWNISFADCNISGEARCGVCCGGYQVWRETRWCHQVNNNSAHLSWAMIEI